MDNGIQDSELLRLRNRHVAKLLDHLGAQPPYLEAAIKRSYSMFAQDVEDNCLNKNNSDNSEREKNELVP